MAYSETAIIDVGALKSSLNRVKQTILAEISKSGHAKFQKVDAVPEATAAEENILYLVKNAGTNHYDIYAKIDGTMELAGDAHAGYQGDINGAGSITGTGTLQDRGGNLTVTTIGADIVRDSYTPEP